MKTTNNNRKSKFLALLLSVMMVSSAGAIFAACTDDTDSSSDSSSSSSASTSNKTDTGLIKNANFDFTTLSNTTAIGTSVTGWTRSVNSVASGSAVSSKAASGVIDTSADSWKYLTTSNYTEEQIKNMSDADAIKNWDNFTVKDKLAFYDAWNDRDENDDKKIAKEFKKYEAINVDEDDIPVPSIGNPGTRPVADGETLDSKILMIHNEYSTSSTSKTMGTAQKYTSSSTVTIPAGSSAEFSVWVRTADLKCASSGNGSQDAVGKGAYISVTHSVGGKSLDAYEVKNIQADEWTQYTFYIRGSSYTSTTFSVVLGLGQGGGNDRLEYVNGYAFFDDMQCNIITNEDFDTNVTGISNIATLETEKFDKTVDAYSDDRKAFAMDFYSAWDSVETKHANFFTSFTEKVTESSDGIDTNTKFDTAQDVIKVFDGRADVLSTYNSDTTKYEYLKYIYDDYLTDKDAGESNFIENEKMLLIFSQSTAYTVENAYTFKLAADEDYKAISFFVKTSDLGGGTGAGITLVDGLNKTAFSSISTAGLAGVTIGEDEDAYDGWQQVFFFVEKDENLQGKDAEFTLTFNYGPTDVTVSTAKNAFTQGFAAFAKFEEREMTELEYESSQTGSYAKKVTLKAAEEDKAAGNSGFDSAAGVPSNALEMGLAHPQNYKGIYNDSYYVTRPAAGSTIDNEKRQINQYANAGLLNKEKFTDELVASNAGAAWLEGLKTTSGKTSATDIWNKVFGEDVTQPLFIWNTGMTKPYGFIGTSKSTSSEYTAISVRVKTSSNAIASIYLIDMDDETRASTLSINGGLTYWYDDNGNVCTGDPTKSSTQVAFKLQSNGLYLANKNWDGYTKLDASVRDQYFANLSAYETNENGDKVAAEGSATHAYYDSTWDREVFYGYEGKFYTEKNGKGVQVLDFASITKASETDDTKVLPYRYLAEDSRELKVENITTNGEWATVTFYIRKGANMKNYRLEVWSGTRGGMRNADNSYVIFDTNNPGNASENFANLIEEYKDDAVDTFDGVFSYYDTDKHVKYDAEKDTDKVGNLYAESFTASAYTAGTAYLKYTKANASDVTIEYTIFADYSLSEQTVAAQAETDDDDTTTSDDDDDKNETNVWLLASSIAVAGVLILAVCSIIARKVIEKIQKKRGYVFRKPTNKK